MATQQQVATCVCVCGVGWGYAQALMSVFRLQLVASPPARDCLLHAATVHSQPCLTPLWSNEQCGQHAYRLCVLCRCINKWCTASLLALRHMASSAAA